MAKLGTESIKKLLVFGAEFGEVAHRVRGMKDANFVQKAIAFLQIFDEAADLLTLDLKTLRDEYFDLDPNEILDLKKFMAEEFDIADDELEGTMEATFSYGCDLAHALQNLANIWAPQP